VVPNRIPWIARHSRVVAVNVGDASPNAAHQIEQSSTSRRTSLLAHTVIPMAAEPASQPIEDGDRD
jgi:hypothetical protein